MKKRLKDLAEQSYYQNRPIDSDFLSMDEYSEYIEIKNALAYSSPTIYKDDWERKLIHFGPGKADIVILKIISKSKNFVNLSHPDYLGALIALGVERRVIGDIIAFPDHAYVYVKGAISQFIKESLYEVGRASVSVIELENVPDEAQNKIIEDEVVVSSLRPDKLIATIFKMLRSKASLAISEGLVFINGLQIKNSNKMLVPGDQLTLRHHGKVKFISLVGKSKKGYLIIKIGRFV